MKLADLTKPQWDAAQHAARCLIESDPKSDFDRASFRAAVSGLCALLPEEVDGRAIIADAARWSIMNDLAAALAGMPAERFAA